MNNILKKLQNIKIEDLSKIKFDFDMSQINVQSIRETLDHRKDIFINSILVLTTLFGMHYYWKVSNDKMAAMKNEMAALEEKQKTAIMLEDAKKRLDALIKVTPQGFPTETEIIKGIINLAATHNVDVIFYTPTGSQKENYYTIQTINFTLASTYANMLSLMQALEKNKENLRINTWKNSAGSASQRNARNKTIAQEEEAMGWEISVSSTRLNHEE